MTRTGATSARRSPREHSLRICRKIGNALSAEPAKRLFALLPALVPRSERAEGPEQTTKLNKKENPMRYVCGICGYVYDPSEGDPDSGVSAGTAFEDLPADWVCPVCGASKENFEPEG